MLFFVTNQFHEFNFKCYKQINKYITDLLDIILYVIYCIMQRKK